MKLLLVVSALDLQKPFGATPVLWQLFKGLYEIGVELIIVPYAGHSVDSLWWRTYPNPTLTESGLFSSVQSFVKSRGLDIGKGTITPRLAQSITEPKWRKHVKQILEKEIDVDAVLLVGVPLNHLQSLPLMIQKDFSIPVFFYDVDLPTSLPENKGFSFNYYLNSNLTDFAGLIVTSEGSIPRLQELGAEKIDTVHFGVDPEIYSPIQTSQITDIFFYGNGSPDREENFEMMMRAPSQILSENSFLISGRNMPDDIGNCRLEASLKFSMLRKMCSQSKINLNLPRKSHASVYGTSTVRPFELASLGCCVVSAPYEGLEEWFEIGKEMFRVSTAEESIELYKSLLDNAEERTRMGQAARARVIKEHTHRHRAEQLLGIIKKAM